MAGISAALTSIQNFKNKPIKDDASGAPRGITFDRGLINAHLLSETFSDEERAFVKSLIYPNANQPYYVDTAFAVFVLFNVDIPVEKKKLGNADFRDWILNTLRVWSTLTLQKFMQKLLVENLTDTTFIST